VFRDPVPQARDFQERIAADILARVIADWHLASHDETMRTFCLPARARRA